MGRIKIFVILMLIMSLVIIYAGCGTKKSVTLDGEGGDIEIGTASWDKEGMYGLKAPDASLDSFVKGEDALMYVFSEMKADDAADYREYIQKKGFTYNMIVLENQSFTGTDKDGRVISFTFDKDSGSGTITAAMGDVPDAEDNGNTAESGDSSREWDSSIMGGLPDPGSKITSYWMSDGDVCYTFAGLDDYKDYLEKIKGCGYTAESSEVEVDGTFSYTASDAAGNRVTFVSSAEEGSVVYEKAGE
jgi:hypothetical protein